VLITLSVPVHRTHSSTLVSSLRTPNGRSFTLRLDSIVSNVDFDVRSLPVLHISGVNEHQQVLPRLFQALMDRPYDLTAHFVRLEPTSVFSVASMDTTNVIVLFKSGSLHRSRRNLHRRPHRLRIVADAVAVAVCVDVAGSRETAGDQGSS